MDENAETQGGFTLHNMTNFGIIRNKGVLTIDTYIQELKKCK